MESFLSKVDWLKQKVDKFYIQVDRFILKVDIFLLKVNKLFTVGRLISIKHTQILPIAIKQKIIYMSTKNNPISYEGRQSHKRYMELYYL